MTKRRSKNRPSEAKSRDLTAAASQEQPAAEPSQPLLEVRDLKVHFPFARGSLFHRQTGFLRAVDGISFDVLPGETFGLVGESGCGKSTAARAILNLIQGTAHIAGEVRFLGQPIHGLPEWAMRSYRREIQMIFQDPFASLNPRMSIGRIVGEPMRIFGLHDRRRRKLEVMRLLDMVGLNPRFLNRYPHEFSGGQRQRIGIARALAVQPKLIICDEPVSSLDVSIQAQVVNLLMDLQAELGLAYIFIAHDLSVVRHISDRIGVMYLGRIVEIADSQDLYATPRHPYTQALLSAVPIPDPERESQRQRQILRGEAPSPEIEYAGCPFAERCPIAEPNCRDVRPYLEGQRHLVSCHLAEKDAERVRA